jgi:hypothetical protein
MPNPTSPYGRQQVEWPDFAADGGTTLHSQVVGGIEYFSDQITRIWTDTQTVADAAFIDVVHNFDVLNINALRVRIHDPASAAPEYQYPQETTNFTIVWQDANTIRITNISGSSKDIQVYVEPRTFIRPGDLDIVTIQNFVQQTPTGAQVYGNSVLLNQDTSLPSTDATAEGGGLNMFGTSLISLAKIKYDSALASKWAAGATGSEVQIVTVSHTQVITNKDIDGGTASNARRLTVPKNTKTNLDALTRKVGTIVYATDEEKLYADNGSILVGVGGTDLTNIDVDIQPDTDGGRDVGTAAKSFNALWLKDTVTGDAYRLEVTSGVLQAVLVP